jgi:hypothetical protein
MVIGILQPGYLPWLGFFEQLYRSDIFVIYDDVQYDRGSWRNRNRIKTANGTQWLTVPVRFNFGDRPLVYEVAIDNTVNWRKKHAESIRQSYARSPFFARYWPLFEEAFDRRWDLLIDLDLYFIEQLAACLGLADRRIIRSSDLNIAGDRIGRLLAICSHFKADVFYEGAAGRNYIDDRQFMDQGITVQYQDYCHPMYTQLYGECVPYLSVIDLLFNHGEQSHEIIVSANTSRGER